MFNWHVFKEEQNEYMKEKIDWTYVDFADNQDTLDLIEKKPMCILTLLDEESTFPKATNLTFATKLYGKLSQHKRFEKPRFGNSSFTIDHYAGKVTYETEGFLEKNKACSTVVFILHVLTVFLGLHHPRATCSVAKERLSIC